MNFNHHIKFRLNSTLQIFFSNQYLSAECRKVFIAIIQKRIKGILLTLSYLHILNKFIRYNHYILLDNTKKYLY